MYEILVGEVGNRVLMHTLKFWQIRAALRGYFRKERSTWEATRIHLYYIMMALGGGKDLKKPSDLFPLAWDRKEVQYSASEKEIEDLQKWMTDYNKKHAS